jgi:hypothetical protein
MGASTATKERAEKARHKVEDATKSARHSAAEGLAKAATIVEPTTKHRRVTFTRIVLLMVAAAIGAWVYSRGSASA